MSDFNVKTDTTTTSIANNDRFVFGSILSDGFDTIEAQNLLDSLFNISISSGGASTLLKFNAKSFGAKFDGTTDDTTAIQNALDAANLAGGGVIILPIGTAIISSSLLVKDNCALIGQGIGATTLKAKALTGSSTGLTGIARTPSGIINKKVRFQDFTIDGNKSNQPQGTITSVANNGSGAYRITSASHGLTTGARVTTTGILGTTGANNSWNVTVITANTFDLISSTFSGSYTSGGTWAIEVVGFFCGVTPNSSNTDEDIHVVRVEVQNCTAYGFDPHERTTRAVFLNCVSHDNRTDGFTLDALYDSLIQGCVSYNNGRHGFNGTTAPTRLRIVACEAYGNGTSAVGSGNGFTLQNAPVACEILNCLSRNNDGDGIYVNGGTDCVIQGNLVRNCTQHGIELYTSQGASVGNTIMANIIRDGSLDTNNSYQGIYLNDNASSYHSYTDILNNSIQSTGSNKFKYGISEKTSGSDNNFIVANRISGTVTAKTNLSGTITASLAAHNGINEHPTTSAYVTDSPSRHGFTEWNFDIATQGTGTALTSGSLTLAKIIINNSGTVSNVILNMSAVGTNLTSNQQFVAIYDASSGVLLGQSTAGVADSIFVGSTGKISIAIATPFSVTSGQAIYIGILSVNSGGTCPSFVRSAGTSVTNHNLGLTTTNYKFAVNTTGLTSVPAGPLTLSANTGTNAVPYWCALS